MTRKLISIVLAVCMIMSCFAVTGMSVSAATVSEATGAAQFKFTDAMNWGDIRLYAWDANQNAVTAQWPGNSGVQGQQNEYGQMVYTINVPNGAAGVIVNGAGGSKQTANITNFAPAGGGYYVDSSRTEVNDMGATVYTAIPWGGTTGSESTDPSNSTNSGTNEIRVSLPGDAPGSAWYAWTWDEGGQGDWRNITRPSYVGGLKSKVLFANFASDNTAKNWDNVLAQTADFTVQNHKMLVISNNKDGQNHYTGSWVDDSYFGGDVTDPVTTTSKTVYFAAPTTWSAVDLYYGSSTSDFNASTKLAMTKTNETVDVTISGLTTVSTGAWPVYSIELTDAQASAIDAAKTAGFCRHGQVNRTGMRNGDTILFVDGTKTSISDHYGEIFIIDSCYDSKYENRTYTGSWDTYEEPAPVIETTTQGGGTATSFKFTDAMNWGDIRLYAWDANQEALTAQWPGNSGVQGQQNEYGQMVYTINVPANAAGVIVNGAGGSKQTGNITNFAPAGGGYYVDASRTEQNEYGQTVYTPIPWGGPVVETTTKGGGQTETTTKGGGAASFLFTDAMNWGDIRLYAWDANQEALTALWPGNSGVQGQQNEYGQMVYTINVPAGAAGVIVNGAGGSKQTDNITNFAPAGGGYYVDASQTSQNEYGQTVYTPIPWGGPVVETTTKKVEPTTIPAPASKNIYFAAPTTWSAVDFYYGNSTSDFNASTKLAMTKTNETVDVTISGLTTVTSGAWPVYCIEIPDELAATIDAAKTVGFCRHGQINRTGMRNGDTILFVDGTKTSISDHYGEIFIIDDCYDTKYENRTYTGFWDTYETTPVIETTTKGSGATSFLFTDAMNWGDIRLYAWDANKNAVTAAWPGNSGVQGQPNEYGQMVYTINVPANAAGVIVNGAGGSKQTDNITNFAPAGGGYYVDASQTSTNEFGATVYTPIPWGGPVIESTTKGGGQIETTTKGGGATSFLFTDAMNWGDIRLYAWDANKNAVTAAWPGNSGVQGQQNEYGQMVYTINVPAGAAGVIVNGAGGSKQTDNITNFAPAGGGYYVDASQTATNEFGATVYTPIPWGGPVIESTTKKVEPTTIPAPASKNIYFAAPTTWSAVDFYYGNSTSDFNAATKLPMTKTDETVDVTIDGLTTVTSGAWPVYCIEIPDELATAVDASKVAGFCRHGQVNRTGMRNGDTILFVDGTKTSISDHYGEIFIIDDCYDTKYENRTYTGFWDTYEEPTPVIETTTKGGGATSFLFTDAMNWGDIRLYAWDANENAVTAQWPGNSGVQGQQNEYGQMVYTINVPANAAGVIVNGAGGSKQTANITNFAPAGGGYYVDASQTSTNEFGATVYTPIPWGGPVIESTTKGGGQTETTTKGGGATSFLFTDAMNWGDIRLYAWDANKNAVTAAWPGNSGVQGQQNEYGQMVYTINVPANAAGVIVNGAGGSKQTADITNFAPAGGGYYVDASQTSTNEFGATVYTPIPWGGPVIESTTKKVEPTTIPAPASKNIYFAAPTTWSAVDFYYGNSTSDFNAATKLAMTKTDETVDVTIDGLTTVTSGAWPVYCIEIPDELATAVDASKVAGFCRHGQVNRTGMRSGDTILFVDGTKTSISDHYGEIFIIDDCYDTKYENRTYTGFWDTYETTPAPVIETTTKGNGATSFLFTDAMNWGDIRLYAWDANQQSVTAQWPGNSGVQGQPNEYGQMVYTINVPANAVGVIVNGAGGSKQTADITNFAPAGGGYYVDASQTSTNEFGATVYTPIPWGGPVIESTTKDNGGQTETTTKGGTATSFLFTDAMNWGDIRLYAWDANKNAVTAQWPGNSGVQGQQNEYGQMVYTINVPANAAGVIVNGAGGSKQTADITNFAPAGGGYYVDASQTSTNEFGATVYTPIPWGGPVVETTTKKVETTTVPAVASKNIYFAAPTTWSAVDFYYGNSTSDFNAATKLAMTKTDETVDVTIDGLTTVTSGAWPVYCIEIPDELATAVDASKVAGFCRHGQVNRTGMRSGDTILFVDGTKTSVSDHYGEIFIIDDCYDTKYENRTYTGFWDTYEESAPVIETTTQGGGATSFLFTDAMNWGDIRLYAWDANQNAVTAQWPGNTGVQGQQNEYGQMVYTINVPANAAGVIVNGAGGSKQTANITNFAPAGGGYYVDASRTEQNEFGATVYTAIPWGGTTPVATTAPVETTTQGGGTQQGTTAPVSGTVTFKFTDAMNWGDIRLYAWDANRQALTAQWPGNSGVQGQQNEYGQMVYTITVPAGAAGVIVNGANGSKQTADITNFAPAGGGYYVDASRTSQNEYGQTVYVPIPWGGN